MLFAAPIWEFSHIEEIGTAKLYWDDHYQSLAITTQKRGYLVDNGDFLSYRRAGDGDEVSYIVRPGRSHSVALWPEKITTKEMKDLYILDRSKPFLLIAVGAAVCLGVFLYLKVKDKKSQKKKLTS